MGQYLFMLYKLVNTQEERIGSNEVPSDKGDDGVVTSSWSQSFSHLIQEKQLIHEHLFRRWRARLYTVEKGRYRHCLWGSEIDELVLLVFWEDTDWGWLHVLHIDGVGTTYGFRSHLDFATGFRSHWDCGFHETGLVFYHTVTYIHTVSKVFLSWTG